MELQTHFNRIKQEQNKKPWSTYNASFSGMVMAELSSNRCFENDHSQKLVKKDTMKAHCSFCFLHDSDTKSCKCCMTARYCSKKCQTLHWKKHKHRYKATGQRNSVEVEIPLLKPGTSILITTHPSLQPGGPNYCSPPPKDGSRFIVKNCKDTNLRGRFFRRHYRYERVRK